jgi:SAM-dependent methyltransferase
MTKQEFINFISKKNFVGTKEQIHKYISNYYANEFCDKREKELIFLEIGVRDGHDLAMFADWLYRSNVFGIDIQEIVKNPALGIRHGIGSYDLSFEELDNCHFILGNAYEDKIVNLFENESIDYLIDDGSHLLSDQIKCIEKYYSKVKKGGKIIIEDIGCREGIKNPPTSECIEMITNKAKKLGCEVEIFDLTDMTKSSFSILIEITKR